jgi:hypothetical protein
MIGRSSSPLRDESAHVYPALDTGGGNDTVLIPAGQAWGSPKIKKMGLPVWAGRILSLLPQNQARPAFEAAPALANTDLREERRIVEGGKDALADQ